MNDVLKKISDIGVIPVVVIENPENAADLAKAVLAGEIGAIEVTLRTDSSVESIARIAKEVPEILVGAGTVLTVEQAKNAVKAGAKFVVSPSFSREVVAWCQKHDVPVLPGCSTPADIQQAIDMGLDTVKFFPAEESGGVKKLKSFAEIFRHMKFMPTGGIKEENLVDYLSLPNVLCCGGTWIAKKELISDRKFDEITENCKKAVASALHFQIAHVGINCESKADADKTSGDICKAFGFAPVPHEPCTFAGTVAECMNSKFLGTFGHVAIATPNVNRAMYYLENRGVKFNYDASSKDENGNYKHIYLADEMGGFAFHLLKK